MPKTCVGKWVYGGNPLTMGVWENPPKRQRQTGDNRCEKEKYQVKNEKI